MILLSSLLLRDLSLSPFRGFCCIWSILSAAHITLASWTAEVRQSYPMNSHSFVKNPQKTRMLGTLLLQKVMVISIFVPVPLK